MSLSSEISALYALAHELLYLGMDDSPIYSDDFGRLNSEVFRKANSLYSHLGGTPEEEAHLCLSLLMAYTATFCDDGDKQKHIQHILDRSCNVLAEIPASLLKVRLLTRCYGEVFEEGLANEAHNIINTWKERALSTGELEVIEELKTIMENPYPWSEINE